jgi:hypothetical protein
MILMYVTKEKATIFRAISAVKIAVNTTSLQPGWRRLHSESATDPQTQVW